MRLISLRQQRPQRQLRQLFILGCLSCLCCLFTSCSEEDAEDEYSREFANWQQRNEAFFATLEDSLARGGSKWMKLKNISLCDTTKGSNTDYVYVVKLDSTEQGVSEGVYAKYTDSVRVSYQGRLIPSGELYPDGKVFDGTVFSKYDPKTNATRKFLVSGLADGFGTAVQHMRRGDYWRVYVPYTLGYGSAGQGSIPGFSTLIFDVTLVDFSPAGHSMAPWSIRRR